MAYNGGRGGIFWWRVERSVWWRERETCMFICMYLCATVHTFLSKDLKKINEFITTPWLQYSQHSVHCMYHREIRQGYFPQWILRWVINSYLPHFQCLFSSIANKTDIKSKRYSCTTENLFDFCEWTKLTWKENSLHVYNYEYMTFNHYFYRWITIMINF